MPKARNYYTDDEVKIMVNQRLAIGELRRKCEENDELRAELADKKAIIDRLMFEYCSEEMTPEQIAEYEKHQAAMSAERVMSAAIKAPYCSTAAIGNAIEGGYFGGIINVNGTHKGVIWSPKAEGQIKSILLPKGKAVNGADSPCDCIANMQALIKARSPAAEQIAAMTINGFSDWLIPSRDVLELGYRHFKPTNCKNISGWRNGENPNSVPQGWLYSESSPAKTVIEAFQDGGDEAFDAVFYRNSTLLPDGRESFYQHFEHGGGQVSYGLRAELSVRAVRLIQL